MVASILPNDNLYAYANQHVYSFVSAHPGVLKYVSLVLLTLQNAVLILVMRYVRTRPGDLFKSTTAVILSEAIKFIACLGIIFVEEHYSIRRFIMHLKENIVDQPLDCLKISVPAIVYTLQNNLLYVAVSNLEAATYQVGHKEMAFSHSQPFCV